MAWTIVSLDTMIWAISSVWPLPLISVEYLTVFTASKHHHPVQVGMAVYVCSSSHRVEHISNLSNITLNMIAIRFFLWIDGDSREISFNWCLIGLVWLVVCYCFLVKASLEPDLFYWLLKLWCLGRRTIVYFHWTIFDIDPFKLFLFDILKSFLHVSTMNICVVRGPSIKALYGPRMLWQVIS